MLKRIISCLLAAAMLLSFGTVVFAEDEAIEFTVSISATNEKNTVGANDTGNAGKTFTANVEVTSGESRIKSFGYVWGRDWAKILNETSQSYTPGNDELDYYPVAVWVTAYDENGNALKEVRKDSAGSSIQRMSKKSGINVTPDGKDVFYVGEKKFTLLDDKMLSVNNAVTEEFYVLADDAYGSRVFDTGLSDLTVATFYPEELTADNIKSSGEGNIAYWLNNEFISDSYTGEKLPAEIINNLSEHKYFTSQNSQWQNKSSVLKVALLGRVDYNKYLSKISPIMNGKTDEDYWWLRDVQGIVSGGNGKFGPFLVMPKWNGTEGVNNASKEGYIRPAFYLGKDFFKTVHLDLEKTGGNVISLLSKRYTESELSSIYSEDELNTIYNRLSYKYTSSGMTVDKRDGLKVSFYLKAKTASENEKAFTAIYNSGKLIDVSISDLAMAAGETRKITADFSDTKNYTDIRIYCFDMNGLTPVSQMMSLVDANVIEKVDEDNPEEIADAEIAVANTVYGSANKEMNIYFDNVLMCDDSENYQIDVVCDRGIQQNERWTYTPTAEESFGLTLKVYTNYKDLIQSKDISVKILPESKATNAGNILIIGDTWVDKGKMVKLIADRFEADTKSVNFIGTKSYSDVKYESVGEMLTESILNKTTNNNFNTGDGFDFGAYLADNSLATPDTVVLFIGMNDITNGIGAGTTAANIGEIVSGIKASAPNAKVYVSTLPCPAKTDEAALRRSRVLLLNRKIISSFGGTQSSCAVIDINRNIDTLYSYALIEQTAGTLLTNAVTRYQDAVYPADAGYCQAADAVYAAIK